jgi:hypothetical protein
MRAPRATRMPSTAQRSHAGKKAPNISKEGAPASEQPLRDSSGSARTLALIGRRLIQRSAQYGCCSVKYGSALHQDNSAIFIPTLCRATISHDGYDRRGDDVHAISRHMSSSRLTQAQRRALVENCSNRSGRGVARAGHAHGFARQSNRRLHVHQSVASVQNSNTRCPLEAFFFRIDVVATGPARWRRRRAPWCLTRRSQIRMGLYQLGNLADLWNLRAKGNLSYRRPAP